MSPSRETTAGGRKIEEFYWNGRWIVYIDNKLSDLTYPDAVETYQTDAEKDADAALV